VLLGAEGEGVNLITIGVLVGAEGEGVDSGCAVSVAVLGDGEGLGVGWVGGAETRWCNPACVTSARGVGEESKLSAVEGIVGRAAVCGSEGHEAGATNVNAERVAGADEAGSQVGVLVAAMAGFPPVLEVDAAAGAQADYPWWAGVGLLWLLACRCAVRGGWLRARLVLAWVALGARLEGVGVGRLEGVCGDTGRTMGAVGLLGAGEGCRDAHVRFTVREAGSEDGEFLGSGSCSLGRRRVGACGHSSDS
jgi:hypothetical protein